MDAPATLLSSASSVLGGLGLFLVGMWLMTDGLKLAAGDALRDLLHTWTNSRVRGLGTGFMITALVQSSSAVTVATIGFANAGLLNLEQAVWVIFGSNVGTTITGWLVALVGFKVNIEAFALPLIGAGMIIRLTGVQSRRGAVGQAIVGFGLFFLGIAVLKDAFAALAVNYQLPAAEGTGPGTLLLFVGIGFLLTTLMQSSSAALVITLGAAEGGVIPLSNAAAVVIGTNLGTTTTAMLSVWGATAVAKRVAASHVLFNLLTATIALAIISPMLWVVEWVQGALDFDAAPATTLALFHTAFNILGVLLMWPVARRMTAMLSLRFVTHEDVARKPKFLDRNVLEVPALAVAALIQELHRHSGKVRTFAKRVLGPGRKDMRALERDHDAISELGIRIGEFVAEMGRTSLSAEVSVQLPRVIQVINRYSLVLELALDAARIEVEILHTDSGVEELVSEMNVRVIALLDLPDDTDDAELSRLEQEMEQTYDTLRARVLAAASEGRIDMASADAQLNMSSGVRRLARQTIKGRREFSEFEKQLAGMAVPKESPA